MNALNFDLDGTLVDTLFGQVLAWQVIAQIIDGFEKNYTALQALGASHLCRASL